MPAPRVGVDGRGRLLAMHVYPWHEEIKDLPGSYYAGGKPPRWAMPGTPGTAAALLTILSGTGAQVGQKVLDLALEASTREQRRALAADESAPLPDLPWDKWLVTSPWDHQQRGIGYLCDCTVAAIGAGMGTGKSLMVVGATNALNLKKVLFVGPSSTLGVFPREYRLHSTREWHIENGQRYTRHWTLKKLTLTERWELLLELYRCQCGKPHAGVVGYEALVRDPMASADLGSLGIELVMYDEAHRLKSAGGAMSKTAYSWVNQIPRRWGLSGTLMPQTPADIYGTYRALDPHIFGTNQTLFLGEFIVMGLTKDGRSFPKDVKKAKRLEFSRLFHSVAYIPVVDLKLPPVTHTIRSFDLEPRAREVYNSIRDTGLAEITQAVIAAGGNPTPTGDERTVAPANAGVELLRWAQITGGTVTDDDGAPAVVSQAKANTLAEVLAEVGCRKGGHDGRSRPEPVVVFCRFKPDLAAVAAVAAKAGLRYREVSGATKNGLDADSKMHPECDVLGAQIASGSEGVDYTRARIAVWYSVGFELWRFQQAQKRVHRPGQTRQTINIYLIAEETIDGDIYTALARKSNVIDSCTNAYLRHAAERPSAQLPAMEVSTERIAGQPVNLPDWLLGQPQPPRIVPDRQHEEEQRVLALGGLEGF